MFTDYSLRLRSARYFGSVLASWFVAKFAQCSPHRSIGPLVVRAVCRRTAPDVVEVPLRELPNICGVLRPSLAGGAGVGVGLRRRSAFVSR